MREGPARSRTTTTATGARGWSEPALRGDSTHAGHDVQRRQVAERPAGAHTDASLLGRHDATPVNIMIRYVFDATASYVGGVAGLVRDQPARERPAR